MEKIFVELRKKFSNLDLSLKKLDKLPGKIISLASSIQYIDLIPKIKKYLESQGKKVVIKKGAYYKAHVLGCNSNAFDKNADTLLLLADGKFHALNLVANLQKPIYIFNTKKLEKITEQEIEKIQQKTKAKLNKFFSQDKIGLIISTKPGQYNKNYQKIKKQIENKFKKQIYIFEANNINLQELENFPQIKIWLNTACPGLSLDSDKILNLSDIQQFII